MNLAAKVRVYSLYMYLSPLIQHSLTLNYDVLLFMHSKVKAPWCYYGWLWACGKYFELLRVRWGYQHILDVGRSCQHILLIMTYFCFCSSLLAPCACCKVDCTVSFVKTAKTNTSTMNPIQLKLIERKYTCTWIIWLCSRYKNFHRYRLEFWWTVDYTCTGSQFVVSNQPLDEQVINKDEVIITNQPA